MWLRQYNNHIVDKNDRRVEFYDDYETVASDARELDSEIVEVNFTGTYDQPPQWFIDQVQQHVAKQPVTSRVVMAALCNNMNDYFMYADSNMVKCAHAVTKYLCNEVPSACWGSKEKVINWK